MILLQLLAGIVLFLFALQLSAFFSGSETGFYRISGVQLDLQAQRGDPVARRLQTFAEHPERFVATTLVGNNVANYLVTVAIGVLVMTVFAGVSGAAEIGATLLVTPVVFIFGELIPKSLYFRAPMALLRSGSFRFQVCYRLFLPISYPLILISRFLARFGESRKRPLEVVLGRKTLYGLLKAGHREGLITGVQNLLAENMLHTADLPVRTFRSGEARILSRPDTLTRDELIRAAEQARVSHVMLCSDGHAEKRTSVVRVVDVLLSDQSPRALASPLPRFQPEQPVLEVLTELFRVDAQYGVIDSENGAAGIISRRNLVARMFRSVPTAPVQDTV